MTNEHEAKVKTTKTITEILRVIQKNSGLTASEIANELNMANSSVHDHVKTLLHEGYLVESDHKYDISLKFLDHGVYAKNNIKVCSIAQPILQQLAEETGEAVWLIVEEHGQAVYIDKAIGENAVPTTGRIGHRTYLHCLSGGKCILAEFDSVRLEQVIARHGLSPQTKHTISSEEELRIELDKVRDQGFAYNDGEEVEGVRAVGTAIVCHGSVIGAISVSGPATRLKESWYRDDLPELIIDAANTIQLKMEYD
ncbi:IclR family transcriptional regulator [Natrarchaeobius chitinivorans]|uniref:IclR family transcriptional regulator n=1 Tax=Natrarchaeobius chitinivorans TaxID=1679083 RepID=A0A3N6NA13_NATCH|nr:IclR family transcriptional regulator [Natrarchaeobius chitinivorans]RQG95412.1 IclR family transcriptional regulator [Natrarchaeobius chitinivorans]